MCGRQVSVFFVFFLILVLLAPSALHVWDVSLLQRTWYKWWAQHRALLKPDNDPTIWIRCWGRQTTVKHAGQGKTLCSQSLCRFSIFLPFNVIFFFYSSLKSRWAPSEAGHFIVFKNAYSRQWSQCTLKRRQSISDNNNTNMYIPVRPILADNVGLALVLYSFQPLNVWLYSNKSAPFFL